MKRYDPEMESIPYEGDRAGMGECSCGDYIKVSDLKEYLDLFFDRAYYLSGSSYRERIENLKREIT